MQDRVKTRITFCVHACDVSLNGDPGMEWPGVTVNAKGNRMRNGWLNLAYIRKNTKVKKKGRKLLKAAARAPGI